MDIEVKMTEEEFNDFTTNRLVLRKLQEVLDKLATLDDSVQALTVAVAGVAERVAAIITPLQDALANAQATIQAERDAAAALAAAEDAEDVQQNAALASAQAATDAALADASQAADQISAQVDQLNTIAQPQQ